MLKLKDAIVETKFLKTSGAQDALGGVVESFLTAARFIILDLVNFARRLGKLVLIFIQDPPKSEQTFK